MTRRASAPALVLATAGAFACLGQTPAQAPVQAPPQESAQDKPLVLRELSFEGGSGDDQLVARAALGFQVGKPMVASDLKTALEALRRTDRFRTVEGRAEAVSDGLAVKVQLDPWPPLKGWKLEGDALPKAFRKRIPPNLTQGMFLGDARLEADRALAETRLREGGYPRATVQARREGADAVVFSVQLGSPELVKQVVLAGETQAYSRAKLLKAAGVEEGRTLWTATALRAAQRGLRQRFLKDKRYQGSAEVIWDGATGTLRLEVHPGPVVKLAHNGAPLWGVFFGQKSLSELAPFIRSDKYGPEQLDETDRRVTRYFRDQGYLNVACRHESAVTKGSEAAPEELKLTFIIELGPCLQVKKVRVEGNVEVPAKDLEPLKSLPSRWLVLSPLAAPDLVKGMEDRFSAFYAQRGYPDARVRARLEEWPGDKEARTLLISVREGRRRLLDRLELDLPKELPLDPMQLGASLAYVLADHPNPKHEGAALSFKGDRRENQSISAQLSELPPQDGGRRAQLQPSKPLPLVKSDLALAVSDLRARLSALGAERPRITLAFEPDPAGGDGEIARFTVPYQPLDHVKRIVVKGADATRPEAIFRNIPIKTADPLDPTKLTEAQSNLADLGAFRRTDFNSLEEENAAGEVKPADAKEDGKEEGSPFGRGDLRLDLEERRPWVFTEGFGYDQSQGYHFTLGAQRLNVGGMGRTLEFGARVGDNTLRSPTLEKWFPTGDFNRSLDSYSVAYTDPWPGFLQELFDTHIKWRSQAAYIEESQAGFLARQRQVISEFSWKVGEQKTMLVGYRFERTEYAPNREGISIQDLMDIAHTNKLRAVISAPYVQFTRDRRDKAYDPTQGDYFAARIDFANQIFGTAADSSFVKLEVRQQWNWAFGYRAEDGVVSAAIHLGAARPTAASAQDLPLSERFYGGGPFSVRGVEPDLLGPITTVPLRDAAGNIIYNDPPANTQPKTQIIPLGGQGLFVVSLEYRFPLFGQSSVWGEVFGDSGQVYSRLNPGPRQAGDPAPFPGFRTTLGLGLIFKLGFPLKVEYAADVNRILGRPRSEDERNTQLKSLLISAGFQF